MIIIFNGVYSIFLLLVSYSRSSYKMFGDEGNQVPRETAHDHLWVALAFNEGAHPFHNLFLGSTMAG